MSERSSEQQLSAVRFGVFEVNFETGELRKSGIRLRLQTQPFKVLAALVRRPGEVISREELQRELWGTETNVDFEHGLGTAVNKLRDALGDSSSAPRYIETLARRGYRFIAPVTELRPPESAPAPVVVHEPPSPPRMAPVALETRKRLWPRPILAACALVGLGLFIWFAVFARPRTTELLRVRQVTWSGRVYPGSPHDESFANLVTDGVRLYFRVQDGGKFSIASAPVAGNGFNSPVTTLSTPSAIVSPTLDDISRDGSKLLVGDHDWSTLEWPLWVLPAAGGTAHRVSNVFAHDATWMPDGQSILYAYGRELWVYRDMEHAPELYARLPGRGFRPRWSPDGSRLWLTIVDAKTRVMSLWEMTAASHKPQAVPGDSPLGTSECCANWTPDGRFILLQRFQVTNSDLWLQEAGSRKPVQLTAGPLQYLSPISIGKPGQLFAIGAQSHTRLNRFDAQSQRFAKYLPELGTAGRFAFSPDGQELVWISTNDGSMWRSRTDGSQRLQLTSPPFEVFMMTWSPDGRQLAVMGRNPGAPWKLFKIAAQGGALQPLSKDPFNQADPTWSPDGQHLAFGRTTEYMGDDGTHKAIYILDVKTGAVSEVPGSAGMFSPRWSPDGKYLAALPLDQQRLMLFNVAERSWSAIATGNVDNPQWTRDSKHIYFDAFADEKKPLYRVRIPEGGIERVADLSEIESADNPNYLFLGLNPQGDPVVSIDRWTADIYSLERQERSFLIW